MIGSDEASERGTEKDQPPVIQSVLPPDLPPVDLSAVPAEIECPDGGAVPVETPEGEITDDTIKSAVAAVLGSVGEALADVAAAAIAPVDTLLADAIAPILEVEGVLTGSIERALDQCEAGYAAGYKSILKPINNCLCECGAYYSMCGVVYPSPQQIAYGLTTGDYLGSVGLTPGCTTYTEERRAYGETGSAYGPATQVVETVTTTICPPGVEPQPPKTFPQPEPEPECPPTTKVEQYFPIFSPSIIGAAPQPEPATVPAPPPAPEKFTLNPGAVGVVPQWDSPDVCRQLDFPHAEATAGSLTGFVRRGEERLAPEWFRSTLAHAPFGLNTFFWEIFHGLSDALDAARDWIANTFRCKSVPFDAVVAKVLVGIVNQWTRGSLDGLIKGFDYKLNEQCPQQIPSQADLDNMLLANQISAEHWICLTKANNNLPTLAYNNLLSQRQTISIADAIRLHRLGAMNDAAYTQWIRSLGVLKEEDQAAIEAAAIDIPGPSDLIRMMVRDVEDPAVVLGQWLDFDFEKKWAGELQKFGDAQGLTPEVALRHWRAHWDYPSATQAFEMLHRLRPGSEVVARINAKLKDQGVDPRLADVTVTEKMVFDLLGINDLAPVWRHRLTAISYRPLTRTDARRAFEIGALGDTPEANRAKLGEVFQDEGYTAENAEILVRFAEKDLARREARRPLPRQLAKWIKRYEEFLIHDEELKFQIKRYVQNEKQRQTVFEEAQQSRDYIVLKSRVQCVRNSYMQGVIDDVQARNQLLNEGIGLDESIKLVESYWCKKKAAKRQITAAQLCQWREQGLIRADDQFRRLVNLGYSADDAERIVQQCQLDVTQKAFAAAKKEAAAKEKIVKEQEKAAARVAREQAKAAKAQAQIPIIQTGSRT